MINQRIYSLIALLSYSLAVDNKEREKKLVLISERIIVLTICKLFSSNSSSILDEFFV
jgi:hypothetical protein